MKKRNMRENQPRAANPSVPFLRRRGGVPAPDSSPERRGSPPAERRGPSLWGAGPHRWRHIQAKGGAGHPRVIALEGLSSLLPAGAAQVEFRQGKVLRPGDFDVVGAGRHDPGLAALALHGLGFVSRHPAFRHHGGKTFP